LELKAALESRDKLYNEKYDVEAIIDDKDAKI